MAQPLVCAPCGLRLAYTNTFCMELHRTGAEIPSSAAFTTEITAESSDPSGISRKSFPVLCTAQTLRLVSPSFISALLSCFAGIWSTVA